jgi:FtsP/CotA-like multicopper oxidase with cupredoxin domain
VVVALRNQDISAGVTLHWHGVAVPNAMDGVASVTQDAVRPGEAFTYRFIAKQVNLYVPPIVVEPGQLVRIHVKNSTDDLHPMHLHGHSFMVLAKNGQPLVGSPVELDTLALGPGEAYDIAFRADNPGLWMDHCHVLRHAAKRMSIMVVYPNIVTPFNVGQVSGNHPE